MKQYKYTICYSGKGSSSDYDELIYDYYDNKKEKSVKFGSYDNIEDAHKKVKQYLTRWPNEPLYIEIEENNN